MLSFAKMLSLAKMLILKMLSLAKMIIFSENVKIVKMKGEQRSTCEQCAIYLENIYYL